MATQTNPLPCDCSTFANFKSWASQISINLGSVSLGGFLQAADPGQVVWTTLTATITNITGHSGSGTVTATTAAPHGFRVGTVDTIAGTTNFNGSFVITAVTSLTFSYAQTNANADESTGTATVNAQTVVGDILQSGNTTNNTLTNAAYPTLWRGIYSAGTTYAVGDVVWNANNVFLSIAAANTGNTPVGGAADTKWKSYCYEIWKSNDGQTPFYFKIEYGQIAANVPQFSLQFGTGTTTTSSLNGNTSCRELLANNSTTFLSGNPSGATANTSSFECDFFGLANGSTFGMILWRNITTTGMSMFVGFERSKNNLGVDTSTFVTYIVGGGGHSSASPSWRQQSLFLTGSPAIGTRTVQAATIVTNTGDVPAPGAPASSWQVGNNIPACPVFPCVGYFANPLMIAQGVRTADGVEGGQFTIGLYGSTHTYMMTIAGWAGAFGLVSVATNSFAMRWE